MKDKCEDRYIIPSDSHEFVGTIYDRSIVGMWFDSHEEISKYPDCIYAYEVNDRLSLLTRRMESLNHVGGMLWPECSPKVFDDFPVSKYEWCNVINDVFLMRFVSISDGCMLLTNTVMECGLEPQKTTLKNLKKIIKNPLVVLALQGILNLQTRHRDERNLRFHRGVETAISSDDQIFKMSALFEFRGSGLMGEDRHGRTINVDRYFKEAIEEMQVDFNSSCMELVSKLDVLYDELDEEFYSRFHEKYHSHDQDHPIYGKHPHPTTSTQE